MLDKIKQEPVVFSIGVVVGAVILLILVLIFKYVYAELFVDENALPAISQALLHNYYMHDPAYTRV